nr:retrovirus-related Pol polyprotein from transposon TNT 1-94 [Tanacetum cinerariifolium]
MHEELLQFKLQEVWTLVDLPYGKRAICTKWAFRNKKDERGIVIRNKARLVAQGHTQEEGIDYDEVFTHVARIEEIRLFLAYASFKDFVAKTVNGEGKLQALVDGKKVLITESTIRRDLKLEDAKGVDCLPNVVIFEQLTLMGLNHKFLVALWLQPFTSQPQKTKQHRKPRRKYTMLPQTSVPTSVVNKAVNEEMDDSLERAATTAPSLDAEQDRGVNMPQSGEDSLKLTELMELCTKLQQIDLETTKTTQEMEIKSLKKIVKKLKRRKKSRTHGLKRLYKVGLSARVESSADKGLGEEDASKQERIADIDANEDITLVSTHDEQMFDVDQDLGGEELFVAQQDEKDDVQAKIDVDYQLAERLQAEEQQELNDEGKAKLFMQLLEKRRKFFAAKRAEEKRNKPPTQAQQRKIMCTYLKNMEGKKLTDLNNKSFDSIQKMFDRAFKRVNTFVDYRTELVEESFKKDEEEVTEGSTKRAGTELEQKSAKKQNIDDDKDTVELQQLVKIIPDEEGVAIDAIPLAVKPPSIVD